MCGLRQNPARRPGHPLCPLPQPGPGCRTRPPHWPREVRHQRRLAGPTCQTTSRPIRRHRPGRSDTVGTGRVARLGQFCLGRPWRGDLSRTQRRQGRIVQRRRGPESPPRQTGTAGTNAGRVSVRPRVAAPNARHVSQLRCPLGSFARLPLLAARRTPERGEHDRPLQRPCSRGAGKTLGQGKGGHRHDLRLRRSQPRSVESPAHQRRLLARDGPGQRDDELSSGHERTAIQLLRWPDRRAGPGVHAGVPLLRSYDPSR